VGLGACKHILAVKILHECEAREKGPAAPAPIALPIPPPPVDEPIPYELTPMGHAVVDDAV
jgi:hypothetical protein